MYIMEADSPYPLVNVDIIMETIGKSPCSMETFPFIWPCSIVMLVYQRVFDVCLKHSTVDTTQQEIGTSSAQSDPAKTCAEPFIFKQ